MENLSEALTPVMEHLENGGEFRYEAGETTHAAYKGRHNAYVVESWDPAGNNSVSGAPNIGYLLYLLEQTVPQKMGAEALAEWKAVGAA